MAANYQQIYTINANIQSMCSLIRSKAFADQLRIEFKSENPTATGVWFRFHHGVTFSSWGEKITITLVPAGSNATQVTIHSECGMPTQVVDWGKNKQVVCTVYEYMKANIGSHISEQPQEQTAPEPSSSNNNFCSNCGAPLKKEANFCGSCGTKLR